MTKKGKGKKAAKKKAPTEVYHCSECRKDLTSNEFNKQPLGFKKGEDGVLRPHDERFAIFCVICGKFLLILDISNPPRADKYKKFSIITNPGSGTSSLG